jgi:hypothetical protein
MRKQSQCIHMRSRSDPHRRIRNIGGVRRGRRWKLTEAEAIAQIEDGTSTVFVRVANRRTQVVVAKHLARKFRKTRSDSTRKDNLLSLPECP